MKTFKNQLSILFLLLTLLAGSQSVFAFAETSISQSPSKENTFKKFTNHTSVFVEEVSANNGFQSFSEVDLYFLNLNFPSYRFQNTSEAVKVSEIKLKFLQHKNKLLDQQIFPFHFFW